MAKRNASKAGEIKPRARKYLSQSDVPAASLDQALRVATAIAQEYGSAPVTPLQLASAMMMRPTTGNFRQLCGTSIAYGLTEGGYNAPKISLTALGKRIVSPLHDGDDLAAKREAVLRPRVTAEFLGRYNKNGLPRPDIAHNVLVDMGVPREKVAMAFDLILDAAQSVGFLRDINGKQYVDLNGATARIDPVEQPRRLPELAETVSTETARTELATAYTLTNGGAVSPAQDDNRRVFITHGKNQDFINPIKKLLGFGEMIPVVSVEKQTVSKPVPEKVMDDMRSCGAAIIHVDAEQVLMDAQANEHVTISPNVLIEIGAAMALYGRRFILLVRDGVRLPSNLQGLYEVRYKENTLDGDATIRLLEAINDIKNNPLPPHKVA